MQPEQVKELVARWLGIFHQMNSEHFGNHQAEDIANTYRICAQELEQAEREATGQGKRCNCPPESIGPSCPLHGEPPLAARAPRPEASTRLREALEQIASYPETMDFNGNLVVDGNAVDIARTALAVQPEQEK